MKKIFAGLFLLFTLNTAFADDTCIPTFDRYVDSPPFVDVMRCVMALHPGVKEKQISVSLIDGNTWKYSIVFSASTYHDHIVYKD